MTRKKTASTLGSVFILSYTLWSCVMDYMPLGYGVRNCTKDTLLLELTTSDTLDGWMYWGNHPDFDTLMFSLDMDTISVNINGEQVIYSDYYYTLPDSISNRIYPLPADSCYMYAIRWQDAIRYTQEEVRNNKLYDRRALSKKDFAKNQLFEYKYH